MKESKLEYKDSLIPLYLGITGHRDIKDEDKDKLSQMITDFIESKKKQCPHTPVVFLTPLAEGADRIAALAAIKCGIDFIAVLPMPVEAYERSFASNESSIEFEYLLGKASRKIVLPLLEGVTISEVFENPKYRHEQYYQVGMFIVKYCHTLIALWDGNVNNKRGGTAEIVQSKRSGIPGKLGRTFERLQHLQTGPVYHIVTPRKNNPSPDNPFAIKVYYSVHFGDDEAEAKKHDCEILAHLDSLNKDITYFSISLKKRAIHSVERLFGNSSELKKDEILVTIANRRGIIRELAMLYQTRRILALRVLLFLVVIAFIFLQVYAEFYNNPAYLIMYPLIMGAGAIWYYLAKRNRFEHKHEDYRALAEAFRVQFYMKVCGSNDNVSDHYLKKHRGELEWVLYTVRSSELDIWTNDSSSQYIWTSEPAKAYLFLKENWIDEQLRYFNRNAEKHNRLNKKWELIANWFFIGAIASACLLFLVNLNVEKIQGNTGHIQNTLHSVLLSLTHVSLIVAAILHGYSDKMIYGEQAKSYLQMAHLFNTAKMKLSLAIEVNDYAEAKEIIWELAVEALLENGDWLLLHRSRPMEMPKG